MMPMLVESSTTTGGLGVKLPMPLTIVTRKSRRTEPISTRRVKPASRRYSEILHTTTYLLSPLTAGELTNRLGVNCSKPVSGVNRSLGVMPNCPPTQAVLLYPTAMGMAAEKGRPGTCWPARPVVGQTNVQPGNGAAGTHTPGMFLYRLLTPHPSNGASRLYTRESPSVSDAAKDND